MSQRLSPHQRSAQSKNSDLSVPRKGAGATAEAAIQAFAAIAARVLPAWVAALTVLAVCGACSSSENGEENGGAAGDGSGQAEDRVGYFNIQLVPFDPLTGSAASTSMVGQVNDGPTPELTIWELTNEQGGCQLLVPRTPFCDPACGSGSACVEDGQCMAHPQSRSVGTVQLTGLRTEDGASTFAIEPIANNYQPSASIKLQYPPFAEGDPVRLETGGGDYAPFVLQSQGIAALELVGDGAVPLAPDQPVMLQWAPPGQAGIARIQVALNIAHHGGERGKITCDVEDSGSLEIPASLVTELIGLGVSGFPMISITRAAVGHTTIEPGRVELVVFSRVERAVEIPGLTSCTEDAHCPTGQTCQLDMRCE